ncbi:MAG: ABC transporter permease [Limnochordaceae bacterium]|nr:ABC transporter permease [Limnochordaceae bacterium]
MTDLGTVYAIWLRELKHSLRDTGQLTGAFLRPILWVMIFGIGLTPYFRGGFTEATFVVPFTYAQFIFPAVAVLNVMYASVQSGVSMIWDREFGFFREILASPAPRPAVFAGKLLGGATVATLQGSLILILAPAADVPLSWHQTLAALGLLAVVALAFTSLAMAIASRMVSFQGFGVFANALILPAYFLASSIFPLDPSLSVEQQILVFPPWMVFAVRVNPVTYLIDALRMVSIRYTQFDPRLDLAVAGTLPAVLMLVAYREFNRR